jgi:hypothetical protein
MPDLSPKQLEVLAFIRRFIEAGGLPPTRGEIAEGLRLKNRQGIDQHLRALAAKGAIELIPGISRGIRLSETPPAGLPLLGRIAAGTPILAADNIEDYVNVDPALFRPAADFLLLHGNGVKDPERIGAIVRETRKVPGYRGVPVLFNEDDHFDFDRPRNNFVAAVSEYASWGYFDFRMAKEGFDEGYQSVPVNWGISSERKRGFFGLVKEMTGS